MFGVLLKKQLREKFSIFGRGRRSDVAGALLSTVLTASVIAVSVVVLMRLAEVYADVRMNGVRDAVARMSELLTAIYAVVFVLGVLSGIKNINFELFECEDRAVFMALPIKSGTVFYSKLVVLYLKQIVLFAVTIIPVNFALAVAVELTPLYILATLGACLVFPALTLVFSSILCFPVFVVKRAFRSRYFITLILTTGVLAALFAGYRFVLEFIRQLFTTGEIRFFFNENVMNGIISFTEYAYPVNFLAKLVLGIEPAKNGLWLGLTAIAALLAGFGVVALLYNKVNLMRASSSGGAKRKVKPFARAKSTVSGLMLKEFFLVYRTPSYAFQYFSVAIVMPLMVYFCMGLGKDLLTQLIMIDASAELGLFLVLAFGALTNTFAATAVSRDGNAFYTLKTMPIKPRAIITAKLLFSAIVAVLSVLISAAVICIAGFVTSGEAAFIFLIGVMMGLAQIAFATRKDLNRPEFSADEDSEVRESTGTVSLIIVIGFLTGLVMGGLALFMSVYLGGKGVENAEAYIMATCFAIAAVLLALSFRYLYKGLDKRLYEMSEGDVN